MAALSPRLRAIVDALIAFAVRVGAFDGRHPSAGALALARLRQALRPGGRLFIDGGNPLREVTLPPAGNGR